MATIRNSPPGSPRLPPREPGPAGPPDPAMPRAGGVVGMGPSAAPSGPAAPAGPLERQHAQQVPAARPGRMSAADAERLAQQSGFVRGARPRRRLGLDVDDVTQGPIPLPLADEDGELGGDAWEQGTMDQALDHLSVHGQQLEEAGGALRAAAPPDAVAGLAELAAALVGSAFVPTPADMQRLGQLAAQAEATPAAQAEAAVGSLKALFGLDLGALPLGPTRVAAALVVAGHADQVVAQGEGLSPQRLAEGIGEVMGAGNRSVADARGMHEGIDRQRGQLTTFVPKR